MSRTSGGTAEQGLSLPPLGTLGWRSALGGGGVARWGHCTAQSRCPCALSGLFRAGWGSLPVSGLQGPLLSSLGSPGTSFHIWACTLPAKGPPDSCVGGRPPWPQARCCPGQLAPPGVVWTCPPLCPRGLQPALSGAWDLSCLGRSRPRRWPSLTVAGEGHISPSGSGRQGLVKTAGWPPLGPRSRDSCC